MYDDEFNGRVFVPSNIRNNKKGVIGKLDIRDILFVGAGLTAFIVIFNILKSIIGNSSAFLIAILISIPIIILSFIRFDGLKVEEYLLVFRTNKMLSNKVRINNSDNIYEIIEKKNNNKISLQKKKNINDIVADVKLKIEKIKKEKAKKKKRNVKNISKKEYTRENESATNKESKETTEANEITSTTEI